MIYIGKYSPRQGTAASKLIDDVAINVKIAREKKINDQLNIVRTSLHSNIIGNKLKILVFGAKKGITYYNHEVKFEKPISTSLVGTFIEMKINGSTKAGLIASL